MSNTNPRRNLHNLVKFLIAGLSASVSLTVFFFTVRAFPTPVPLWLSFKGTGTSQGASNYYASLQASNISVPATFSGWLQAYGFNNGDDAHAIYYNAGDLGLGRDMHCRRNGADIACYVVNHGIYPGASQ